MKYKTALLASTALLTSIVSAPTIEISKPDRIQCEGFSNLRATIDVDGRTLWVAETQQGITMVWDRLSKQWY